MWFLKKQVKNCEYVSKNSQLVSLQHTEPIHKTFFFSTQFNFGFTYQQDLVQGADSPRNFELGYP